MKKLLRKFVSIALVLSIVCSSYGLVLCHSADGRIVVEPVIHSACHQDHEHASDQTKRESYFSQMDTCGTCIDVVMKNDLASLVKFSTVISCFSVRLQPLTLQQIVPSSPRENSHAHFAYTYFVPLDSIVLLT